MRKHRLAERLLTDIIGLPWEKAHLEAGRWEHVISDEVEARLVEILGHPTTCPHGNPIPGPAGRNRCLTALSESNRGDHVRLERVTEQMEIDLDSLAYLSAHGFVPGTEATVASRAPDGTLILDLGPRSIALGPSLAQQLFVTAAKQVGSGAAARQHVRAGRHLPRGSGRRPGRADVVRPGGRRDHRRPLRRRDLVPPGSSLRSAGHPGDRLSAARRQPPPPGARVSTP